MIEPQRKQVPLAEGAMAYLEWPGDGPPLNFAHANGFNAETYKSLLAPLAGEFHVFACDQRGHGFSTLQTQPGLARGWSVFRDDLIAYLERAVPQPAILAGHSMGATASLMAAAAAPHLVKALVLFEPVLVVPGDNADPSLDLVARTLKRRDTFPSFDAAREAYRGRGIFRSWPDEMLDGYLKGGLVQLDDGSVTLACAPAWEAECFSETPLRVSAVARDVRCPIALIHGTIGSTSFESEVNAIVALRPGSRVLKVEGASHFLPMERPEIVRNELRRMKETLREEGR